MVLLDQSIIVLGVEPRFSLSTFSTSAAPVVANGDSSGAHSALHLNNFDLGDYEDGPRHIVSQRDATVLGRESLRSRGAWPARAVTDREGKLGEGTSSRGSAHRVSEHTCCKARRSASFSGGQLGHIASSWATGQLARRSSMAWSRRRISAVASASAAGGAGQPAPGRGHTQTRWWLPPVVSSAARRPCVVAPGWPGRLRRRRDRAAGARSRCSCGRGSALARPRAQARPWPTA